VISPEGPGREGGKPQRWAAGAGTGRGGAGVGPGGPGAGPRNSEMPGKKGGEEEGGCSWSRKSVCTRLVQKLFRDHEHLVIIDQTCHGRGGREVEAA